MKNLPKNYSSHFPKSKKEEQEFGKGKKDILICKNCDAVYFYKSWHKRLEDYPELKEEKELRFGICPACQMIQNRKYEGKVVLKNSPKDLEKQILNTIKNAGDRALEKDNQDRIISTKANKGEIIVLTTENQLAVRIAKKLKSAFKLKLEIRHSKKDSTTLIKTSF